MWARIHLTPLLQAEEDRDQVRRFWADQAREKELLGENRQVYHTDKYVTALLLEMGLSFVMSTMEEGLLRDELLIMLSSQVREADIRRHAPAYEINEGRHNARSRMMGGLECT
jgi:uncharacterized Fe-S cluster-containing protein